MRSFTNRAANVRGSTTSVTVRLPDEIVVYVDSHLDDDIANRSEFLQHWAQVGVRVSMSEELSEALDWALSQDEEPEPEPEDEPEPSILEEPMVPIEPKDDVTEALEWARGIGVVPDLLSEEEEANGIYADAPIKELPALILTESWRDDPGELNEVGQVRANILEALRSRVR